MHFNYHFLCFAVLLFLLSSCVEPVEPDKVNFDFDVWVLNEGLWNMNNSSLTGYHSETKKVCPDVFKEVNGRGLGDVANDILIYGSKVYIVVNVSALIEVVDIYTGKSIRQIPLLDENGINRQPRLICSYKNKIYGCCFDGSVVRIDTSTLKVDGMAQAGQNPDGICVAKHKLYVSNSGGLNYPDYDHTVSVFDLTTFKETKKIKVGINPTVIKADVLGDVYVLSCGNYSEIQPCLQRIDTEKDSLVQTFPFKLSNFDISGDLLYFYYYDYSSSSVNFQVLNVKTETVVNSSFIQEDISIKMPYAIDVNPKDGSIFIADALDYQTTGEVYCFTKNGKLSYQFEAGLCPKKTIFISSK